jgi:hypothetical protein
LREKEQSRAKRGARPREKERKNKKKKIGERREKTE